MSRSPAMAPARYRSLDHWRGFAALWVLVFHSVNVWLEAQPHLLPPVASWICLHGWLGANVFFVISGYCIAERCTREFREGGTVRGFLVDRLLRIYPPYWAALIFALLLNLAGAWAHGQTFSPGNPLPDGVFAWLRAFGAVEYWFGPSSYLLVAWTLSFELGFYLIAAACLGLSLRTRRAWAGWALGVILLVIGLSPARAVLPLLTLWPNFALGAMVWLLLRFLPQIPARLALGLLCFGAIACLSWKFLPGDHFTLGLMALFAALLLVLQPWDARLADAPWLRWLGWIGTFSYSLYLVHAPIVGKFRNLLGRRWPSSDPKSLWVPLIACGLAIVVAWCFYQVVERRTEKWRREYLGRSKRLKQS